MLTPTQLKTLQAAMNRVIPPDDFPGAWEAGAGDYLLRQLETGDLRHALPVYQTGLDALNAQALATYAQEFADLPADNQDELLRKAEQTDSPLRAFFLHLTHHTAEGYYADPENGGNRDEISWRMIGFSTNDESLLPV